MSWEIKAAPDADKRDDNYSSFQLQEAFPYTSSDWNQYIVLWEQPLPGSGWLRLHLC